MPRQRRWKHETQRVIATDAQLQLRRPTGWVEVTSEPVPLRRSVGKWVRRDHRRPKLGLVFQYEEYYVQVGLNEGLRSYGTADSRRRGLVVGTNARFFKRKFKDGQQVEMEYKGRWVLDFPLKPFYTEDDTEAKRPALRITLGTKTDEEGDTVEAQFYLSTVLGYAYHTTYSNGPWSLDKFREDGWEGDHLVDMDLAEIAVPLGDFFVFIRWCPLEGFAARR